MPHRRPPAAHPSRRRARRWPRGTPRTSAPTTPPARASPPDRRRPRPTRPAAGPMGGSGRRLRKVAPSAHDNRRPSVRAPADLRPGALSPGTGRRTYWGECRARPTPTTDAAADDRGLLLAYADGLADADPGRPRVGVRPRRRPARRARPRRRRPAGAGGRGRRGPRGGRRAGGVPRARSAARATRPARRRCAAGCTRTACLAARNADPRRSAAGPTRDRRYADRVTADPSAGPSPSPDPAAVAESRDLLAAVDAALARLRPRRPRRPGAPPRRGPEHRPDRRRPRHVGRGGEEARRPRRRPPPLDARPATA